MCRGRNRDSLLFYIITNTPSTCLSGNDWDVKALPFEIREIAREIILFVRVPLGHETNTFSTIYKYKIVYCIKVHRITLRLHVWRNVMVDFLCLYSTNYNFQKAATVSCTLQYLFNAESNVRFLFNMLKSHFGLHYILYFCRTWTTLELIILSNRLIPWTFAIQCWI